MADSTPDDVNDKQEWSEVKKLMSDIITMVVREISETGDSEDNGETVSDVPIASENDSKTKDSAEPKEETPSRKYVFRQNVSVDEVGSKFKLKKCIETLPFYSRADPKRVTFSLILDFGSQTEGYLGVFVKAGLVGITVNIIEVQVHDHRGYLLEAASGRNSEPTTDTLAGRGLTEVIKSEANDVTWNLEYTIEYTVPLSIREGEAWLEPEDDYSELYESGKDADVTIVVQGEKFMAHKTLLENRSEYFEMMFKAGMRESISNRIEVTDVAPSVYNELLKFLYSGVTPYFKGEETCELFVAAHKYEMEDLEWACELILCDNLTEDNAVDALILANTYHSSILRTQATTVIKMACGRVPEIEKLKSKPELLLELMQSCCKLS